MMFCFTKAIRHASIECLGLFALLDELEPTLFDSVSFRPRTDLHWLPLAAVLVTYLLLRLMTLLIGLRPVRSVDA